VVPLWGSSEGHEHTAFSCAGVTQKYLLVTCNYAARKMGVTKLMSISDAKKACPDIALIAGEDLTPYRRASKRFVGNLTELIVGKQPQHQVFPAGVWNPQVAA
jgi:impB/mucB/samB family